jgi:hypothetical protein
MWIWVVVVGGVMASLIWASPADATPPHPLSERPAAEQLHGVAPTYTIFATREGLVGKKTANGHIIQPRDRFVSLPSKRVLSSFGGNEYQVRITYKGRSVVAPVWDVGPWNEHDDYWSANRERHSDLPVGVPMAQAAYLEGYNGGLDEFGRVIQNPNGIDIADGTFWDDLGMTRNDWVQVSFLWLGEDPGPGSAANIIPPPTTPQQEIPTPQSFAPPAPAAPKPNPAPPATTDPTDPAPTSVSKPPKPVDNPQVEAGGIAVDNSDASYMASSQAPWFDSPCGLYGSHSWTYSTNNATNSENHALWRPKSLSEGVYEVKAYIPPACSGPHATTSASYRVTHNGRISIVKVDQRAAAGTWVSLGTYRFGEEGAQLVELNDVTSDSMQAVRFDAIAWIPSEKQPNDGGEVARERSTPTAIPSPTPSPTPRIDIAPPDAFVVAIIRDGRGYLIQWDGTDDVSGIASYDVQVKQLPRGGWRDWIHETTAEEAWFGPDEGKHFAFRVRARDNEGHLEDWPDEADMDTTQALHPDPKP